MELAFGGVNVYTITFHDREEKPMSITESLMRPDPYAPLAKLASTVLVAIEKLRLREALKDEEQSSFPVIAKELSMLSRARELGTGAPIPSYLHRSFCTLVA